MITKIFIDTFYTIKEFLDLPQALKILEWEKKFDLYLPTEFHSSTPTVQVPDIARAYPTSHRYVNGEVVSNDDFMIQQQNKKPDKRLHLYNVPSVYLFEYWEDEGSDGHVSYRHRGYFFSTFDKFQDRQYPEDHLRDLYHEWRMSLDRA